MNTDEAECIFHFIQDLMKLIVKNNYFTDLQSSRNLRNKKDSKLSILILCTYKAQVDYIQSKLEVSKIHGKKFTVDCATIDSYQGGEADFVLLSLVRTDSTGFITDWRRVNVACSRAKFLLCIVGKVDLLRQTSAGVWKEVIEFSDLPIYDIQPGNQDL